MPSKYAGLDGRKITQQAREDIARAGVEMSVMAQYDHYPAEHRARLRAENTARVRAIRAEAKAAVREWAERAAAGARRRLGEQPVGTPAEESRRVATETKIGRLVASARAGGAAREEAASLAERANAAYEVGNLDEADVLAQASLELGGPRLAEDVSALVRYDRVAADPSKARAMKELDDIEVVTTAFERDLNATYAQSLQDSARLARAIGESESDVAADIGEASRTAKMAAWVGAQKFGDGTYTEPAGVIGEMKTVAGSVGSGRVPQPEGATLPEPRS